MFRLLALIKKEFLTIWRDPKSRTIILVPPIMQLIIFANALNMEIKNINLLVIDYANTTQSREFIAKFESSKWFKNIHHTKEFAKAKSELDAGVVDGVIIINNDFSKNISSGKTAEIQLLLDGRNTSIARATQAYTSQIAQSYSYELIKDKAINLPSVDIQMRNWFNPNAIYQWYILSVLLVMLSLVITLVLTALSIARERELGTFEQLIVSPYSALEILLGKTIPPLLISLGLLGVIACVAIFGFGVAFTGSFLLLFFSATVSLLSFVGIGLFISSICKNQQQAILGVFAFMMPSILLSGFISPIEDMPLILQDVTYLNPIRFFLNISKGLFLKDMPLCDVITNLIPIALVALFTLSAAAFTFKRNLE